MSERRTIRRKLRESPEGVMRLLVSPEFLVARHRAQGAIEVTVRELARGEGRLRQEVLVKEPAHTLRGVDPRKLESAVTTYDWNLRALRGAWSYRGPHGPLVRIEGAFVVETDGRGSALQVELEVSVRSPLLRGQLERRIMMEIEAGQSRLDALLEEFLARR